MLKTFRPLYAFASCLFILSVMMPITAHAWWWMFPDVCWCCVCDEYGNEGRYWAISVQRPGGGTGSSDQTSNKVFLSKGEGDELKAVRRWGLYGDGTPPRYLKISAQGSGGLSDSKFKKLLAAHPKATNIERLSKGARKAMEDLSAMLEKTK